MLETVDFNPDLYGADVARILALDGNGCRQMPLAGANCAPAEAFAALHTAKTRDLFPGARSPEGALTGMFLYFSCLDEAHKIAQDLDTGDGSFWHGIMHRREPDAGNAAYWFRRVGQHPVFPELRDEARRCRFDTGKEWNPFEFIEFCEGARERPGSDEEHIAMQVQLIEWQLLFDYCARAVTGR
ncbi:MAG: hypothetical protein KGN84_05225 [Acidobacteriota bacterium]|nr:hypothetical protein [Acidobacteriota bacterium]